MNRGLFVILGLILVGMGYLAVRVAPDSSSHHARPIKIATGTWEPFVGPHLEGGGPIGEIVTETIRRMGYEPQLSFSSWDLTLNQTRRGEVFGAFSLIRSAARDSLYAFSDPILTFEYVLFYHNAHIPHPDAIQTAEDLASYRAGIVRGYEVWKELAPADSHFASVDTFDTSTDAFRALADGDIDFLPEGRIPGLVIVRGPDVLVDANAFGFLDATVDSSFASTDSLHFLMPQGQGAEAFLDDFNRQLAEVKKTPLYRDAARRIRCALYPVEEVELRSASGELFASVVETGEEAVPFAVPIGTRAVVLAWPSSFMPQREASAGTPPLCRVRESDGSQDEAPTDGPPLYKVKLLNGPQRGRVVLVDARAVSLTR